MVRYDVIIVGSGPAGALAAVELARHGLQVCLAERATHPRYKACGGGVLARAARLIPLDLAPAVARACRAVELRFSGGDTVFRTTRATPVVFMTMRPAFDRLLVAEAVRLGAGLREGCTVTGVTTGADGVVVQSSDGELAGRFVIAADGAGSIVARGGGWPAPEVVAPALECEVPVDAATLARFDGTARFDLDHPRGGYSWVFPKEEHLSVGVGIFGARPGRHSLREAFRQYLRELRIEPAGPLDLHGALIPVRPRRGPLVRERTLLVGDAAGLADPVTAEGITPALLSGRLAARALLEGELEPAGVAERYTRLLEEEILGELKVAGRLARFFYGHPLPRNLLFRSHGQRFCEKVTDIMTGERRYTDFDLSAGSFARLLSPR